jgi:hypothetical protein
MPNQVFPSDDDFEYNEKLISLEKAESYNKARDEHGILSPTRRKRATETNKESDARGMARVGQGKNFKAAETLKLNNATGAFAVKPKKQVDRRDKPDWRDRKDQNDP